MGVWGPGPYQSDDACDVLDAVCGPLMKVVLKATASDRAMRADIGDGHLVPAMDMLAAVYRHAGDQTRGPFPFMWLHAVELPEPRDIKRWRERYLELWHEAVDDLGADDDYRRGRPRVIAAAFDTLLAAARLQRRRWRYLERRMQLFGRPFGEYQTPRPG